MFDCLATSRARAHTTALGGPWRLSELGELGAVKRLREREGSRVGQDPLVWILSGSAAVGR